MFSLSDRSTDREYTKENILFLSILHTIGYIFTKVKRLNITRRKRRRRRIYSTGRNYIWYKYSVPSKRLFIHRVSPALNYTLKERKEGREKKGLIVKSDRPDLHPGSATRVAKGMLIINNVSTYRYDQCVVDDSWRMEELDAWSACSSKSFDCSQNYWLAAVAKAKSACKVIWPWQSSFSSTPTLAIELITSSVLCFVASSFQPHFRVTVCSLKKLTD